MIWQLRLALWLFVSGLMLDSIMLFVARDIVHIQDPLTAVFAALQLVVASLIVYAARAELLARHDRWRELHERRPVMWLYAALIAAFAFVKMWAGYEGTATVPEKGALPYWFYFAAFWLAGWGAVRLVAELRPRGWLARRAAGLAAPAIFGLTLLGLWEKLVWGANIPPVLLPAPSRIAGRFVGSTDTLWADFLQTFVKGALSGYAIGVVAALGTALLVDRSRFLQRGLLPLGNLVAALPIVGLAPIMVMWFGPDWQSKAAVVVAMVFFPVLLNAVEGLRASDRLARDLMRTYAAGYWQTLLKLRLPAALPFIFNGLKIASTLALIGAIVAEFFGSPVVGMGFRISTEVGRMNVDMVWATIAVAALAGSAFYAVLVLVERQVTFWHPSVRG